METTQYLSLTIGHKKAEKIHYDEILYLEGSINYTIIHLRNGKSKVSARTLAFHVSSLNDSFIRIHRSYCVNTIYVTDYTLRKSTSCLWLEGGIQLQIARRRKRLLHTINDCV
jgi:DNA-binding LytR/AlgR family response regulator